MLVILKCGDFFPVRILAWVCADQFAVCPVLNHFNHAVKRWDGVSESFHSQGHIPSRCLQTSTDVKQVGNHLTDETLPFYRHLGFSVFSSFLTHTWP